MLMETLLSIWKNFYENVTRIFKIDLQDKYIAQNQTKTKLRGTKS